MNIFDFLYLIYKNKKHMDKRIHNFLMMSSSKNIIEYRKAGIYFLFGPFKGRRIEDLYKENSDGFIDYLDAIIDNEHATYKMKFIIKTLKKDLLSA
jgi:hypothetical protein